MHVRSPSPEALSTLIEVLMSLALDPLSAKLNADLLWSLRSCLSTLDEHDGSVCGGSTRVFSEHAR